MANYKDSAWGLVLGRERQGGTFVGEDVAIPHARIPELQQPVVAFGVGREGIRDRESGRSVRIMLLLLSPTDPPDSHVQMLSMISRMARDDQWRKQVLSANQPWQVSRATRDWQTHLNPTVQSGSP